MALTQITDHAARARALVLEQYKTMTTKFLPLVDAVVGSVQDAEDALWGYVAMMLLGSSTGVWLGQLGRIVGEERETADDDDYREFIAARVLANKSQGSIEDIIAVVRKVITVPGSAAGATLTVQQFFPAALQATIGSFDFSDVALLDRLRRMLLRTRAAGVGQNVVYQFQDDDAEMFTFEWDAGSPSVTGLGFDDEAAPGDGGHLASELVA
jgi:hypothetical protein